MKRIIKCLLVLFAVLFSFAYFSCSSDFSETEYEQDNSEYANEKPDIRCVYHDTHGHIGHSPRNQSSFTR